MSGVRDYRAPRRLPAGRIYEHHPFFRLLYHPLYRGRIGVHYRQNPVRRDHVFISDFERCL